MPKGIKIAEETKRSITELVENEVRNHIDYVAQRTGRTSEEVLANYGDIDFLGIEGLPSLTINCVLQEGYNVSKTSITTYLGQLQHCLIEYRTKAICNDPDFLKSASERVKKLHADPEFVKAASERMKQLHSDPNFAKATSERGRKIMKQFYSNPEFIKSHTERINQLNSDPEFVKAASERMKQLNSDPNFAKATSERGRKTMKQLNSNPEFVIAQRERGIKYAESLRHKRYNVQGNWYDSQSEAATGVLMEKYIPGYKAIEHKTFQVNTEIKKTIDFLVNDTFVEWHPILAFCGARKLGDISTREEAESYRKVLGELEEAEKREFEKDYKQVLAMNYVNSRQTAINQSSTYKGSELILAQTPIELYDSVITRFGEAYPSREDFVREFNSVKKDVKKAYAERKKTEQKVEAAA